MISRTWSRRTWPRWPSCSGSWTTRSRSTSCTPSSRRRSRTRWPTLRSACSAGTRSSWPTTRWGSGAWTTTSDLNSFNQLHSQQPQTIAHALADSPVGLLGWNAQLMADDAMGERSLDDDFILDNTTLYWLTNTGGESIRFYYEDAHAPRATEPATPTTVPLGLAGFHGDFSGVRRFAERDHQNITQWNLHPEPGGHYAARTEPQVLADDIRQFYKQNA